MRNRLPAIALLVALPLLAGAARHAANLHYVAGGEAGALLYAADFEKPDDSVGLFTGRASAIREGGEILLDPGEARRLAFAALGPHLGDFELEVEARALAGPLDNGFGVLFRLQRPRPIPVLQDVLPGLLSGPTARSYYLFLVSSDGYYQLTRNLSGRQRVTGTWTPSASIRQGLGVSNHLRIRARGPALEFFVNNAKLAFCLPDGDDGTSTWVAGDCVGGQMRDVVVDDNLKSGRIALAAQSLQEPGVVVAFDNVLVRMPAPAEGPA